MTITLTVTEGAADVYVTTYSRQKEEGTLVESLPTRKDDAIWSVEDVNSLNSGVGTDREIVILQNDRSYCSDCYYIIGIVTHEGPCTYNLFLQSINAQLNYTLNLLKLGTPRNVRISRQPPGSVKRDNVSEWRAMDAIKRYQFMLDSKEPASLIPTVTSGQVKLHLSFGTIEDAFAAEQGGKPI